MQENSHHVLRRELPQLRPDDVMVQSIYMFDVETVGTLMPVSRDGV